MNYNIIRLEDIRADPKQFLSKFITYTEPSYRSLGDLRDEDAYTRLSRIGTLFEDIEKSCGKDNYHFNVNEPYSDWYLCIDMSVSLKELHIYEITSVDLDALSNCFKEYEDILCTMNLFIKSAYTDIDVGILHGRFSSLVFNVPMAKRIVIPAIIISKSLQIIEPIPEEYCLEYFFTANARVSKSYNSLIIALNHKSYNTTSSDIAKLAKLINVQISTDELYPSAQSIHQTALHFKNQMHDYLSSIDYQKLQSFHNYITDNAFDKQPYAQYTMSGEMLLIQEMPSKYRSALQYSLVYYYDKLSEYDDKSISANYDEYKYNHIKKIRTLFGIFEG